MRRFGPLTRGSAQVFLIVLALGALAGAVWTYRYWSRGGPEAGYPGNALALLRGAWDGVQKGRIEVAELAVVAPALAAWTFGPFVGALAAALCALAAVGIRRGRTWSLIIAVTLAVLVIPMTVSGRQLLRGLESRIYWRKSPYVRTYHALMVPLAAASGLCLALWALDGTLLARRRRRQGLPVPESPRPA